MKRFLMILMAALCAAVAMGKPLDEIQSYEIWVEPREDATLDMRYKISWKVLDSTTEGPLTWVKVGVPNGHLDAIKPLSGNIRKARYYEENGQYIRLDLDRAYTAGETVTFEYSFHQRYMFQYHERSENGNVVFYDFTPGWFDDIDVKSLVIRWKADGVTQCSVQDKEGGYYILKTSLPKGRRASIMVKYDMSRFPGINVQENADVGNKKGGWRHFVDGFLDWLPVIIIVFILFVQTVGGMIRYNKREDPYYYARGFVPKARALDKPIMYFMRPVFGLGPHGKKYTPPPKGGFRLATPEERAARRVLSGGHHHYGGGCACASACACACAGGGRAGCSRKDFYHPKLNTDQLERAIIEKRS